VATTTILPNNETKDLIGTFGTKEETYNTIVKRRYKMAVNEQLRQFLMSSKDCISLDEAKKRLNKKWPKSK